MCWMTCDVNKCMFACVWLTGVFKCENKCVKKLERGKTNRRGNRKLEWKNNTLLI